MRTPYYRPAERAYPDIRIPEPRISKGMLYLVRLLGRFYLMLFLGIGRIALRGGEYLFPVFQRVLRGDSRCILAFRHPNGGEPQLLTWFVLFKLRTLAARAGYTFARRPHVVFVYGYEVLRWGGWAARLVMPRLGAMPVHHAKMDTPGMIRIYQTITEGPYPLAIAPEGQVSYTAEDLPRLEQGAIRIGFQAAEQLARKGKNCPVEVLPVSVHYRYGPWGDLNLWWLLRRVERFAGLARKGLSLTERLRRCREHILAANEGRYGIRGAEGRTFDERLEAVTEAALRRTEAILAVKRGGEEDFFSRLYRLRQICWDRIYLPGKETLADLSPVERGAADLGAGEAWHAGRHLELADFSWYFRRPLPVEEDPLHFKIEYVQNLWDFANRSIGGAYSNRINIFPRWVIFQAAPPLNLTERLPVYRADKKTAITQALSDLRDAYLDCIKRVNAPAPPRGAKIP